MLSISTFKGYCEGVSFHTTRINHKRERCILCGNLLNYIMPLGKEVICSFCVPRKSNVIH